MRILIFLVTVGLADIASLNVSQEDFDNLVKQVSLMEATVEGLEDQNAVQSRQIADLVSDAEDQESKIQALEATVEGLEEQNVVQSEQIEDLLSAVEDHGYQIAELQNDNEILAAQNENLIERVTRLEVRFWDVYAHFIMVHNLWFI